MDLHWRTIPRGVWREHHANRHSLPVHARRPVVHLDFLFAQVLIDEARVDTTPNCGNMLAAVGPFALERGLIAATGAETTVRILTRNTGMLSDVALQTPDGRITYAG